MWAEFLNVVALAVLAHASDEIGQAVILLAKQTRFAAWSQAAKVERNVLTVQLRRDLSDIPVLRQITEMLGSEVWFNTLNLLTHARSPGPLGPNGQLLPFNTLSETRAAMLLRAIQ